MHVYHNKILSLYADTVHNRCNTLDDQRQSRLLDSGSEVHSCSTVFAPSVEVDGSTAGSRNLRDVQSNPIAHYGTKTVKLGLTDSEQASLTASARFEVSDVFVRL